MRQIGRMPYGLCHPCRSARGWGLGPRFGVGFLLFVLDSLHNTLCPSTRPSFSFAIHRLSASHPGLLPSFLVPPSLREFHSCA